MPLSLYQIDSFSSEVFGGNPAAVVPLEHWLTDELMQKIAEENNLSETAFYVQKSEGVYEIRFFTPRDEVNLCGHATLASAWLVHQQTGLTEFSFAYSEGTLNIAVSSDGLIQMSLPVWDPDEVVCPEKLSDALGVIPAKVLKARDYICILPESLDITQINPDFSALAELDAAGVVVTAIGEGDYDVVSRGFYPRLGVSEDPVTGSSTCSLMPYWSTVLGKQSLTIYQASRRGGVMRCSLEEGKVLIEGDCALYMKGEIYC